jgi:putative transposase
MSPRAGREHFGGLEPADVKRLKALELENAKLKKLLAERDLEIDVMREVNRKKW